MLSSAYPAFRVGRLPAAHPKTPPIKSNPETPPHSRIPISSQVKPDCPSRSTTMSLMGIFRQLSPEPQSTACLQLVVHFLYVHKSLPWTGGCNAKDFPLACDYRPNYGPE